MANTPVPGARTLRDLTLPPPDGGRTTRIVSWTRLPATTPEAMFQLRRDPLYLRRFSPLLRPHVEALGRPTEVGDLERLTFNTPFGRLRWDLGVTHVAPDWLLVDEQVRGPFRFWRHQHLTLRLHGETVLVDIVDFRLVPTALGFLVDELVVGAVVRVNFALRHRSLRRFLGPRGAKR